MSEGRSPEENISKSGEFVEWGDKWASVQTLAGESYPTCQLNLQDMHGF